MIHNRLITTVSKRAQELRNRIRVFTGGLGFQSRMVEWWRWVKPAVGAMVSGLACESRCGGSRGDLMVVADMETRGWWWV
ncbi:hypothetical protein E3N88_33834 [Mikania micrantha]|uniref:Uncharacterized protein n=1 Tax=Mikania micrantha TaxID=192012 RepID=A0A5N6MD49_9ASTR|nr:hypothetical protein E3N88_33834 [Mikania micrantha]